MLLPEQIGFFREHGFLRLEAVFSAEQTEALRRDLDWMIESWADESPGWIGPWRRAYMDEETERRSKLIAMHDLHFYSEPWMRALTNPELCQAMSLLLDGPVELHHSTMHVKPPQTGHPFPMHQDWAFYQHADGRYVDALIHLDDTRHENGEIRFLDGSHKGGALEHITKANGEPCTPHLSTDQYGLEQTVAVPAKAGDVVCFSIHTIHGSYINRTDRLRRIVRAGYRHPDNVQLGGQSYGRPGLIVSGRRTRREGAQSLSIDAA
jgi:phytanoyl-CoA hydroxylase